MPNVVIVGAGSLEVSSRLSADLLSFPALALTHFALVDVDPERLEFAGLILERIIREVGYQQASYCVHADRCDAFDDADFVIISILVGGCPAIASEIDIPRRYGVDQAIGDTLRAMADVETELSLERSTEYGAPIIHAMKPMPAPRSTAT